MTAPSSGVKGALSPAMSVFTQPGQQLLTNMSSLPEAASSLACILLRAMTAVLLVPYLELFQPSSLALPVLKECSIHVH